VRVALAHTDPPLRPPASRPASSGAPPGGASRTNQAMETARRNPKRFVVCPSSWSCAPRLRRRPCRIAQPVGRVVRHADAAPPEAPVDSPKQTFSVAATAEKRHRGRDGREGAMGARPPTGGWRRRELTGRRVAPPLRTCGPCGSRIYDDEPCGSAVGGQSDERERQRPSTPATSMLRKQDRSSPAPKATRLSCRRPCPPR
jgi:hypothetical protein